ncbi:MAG: DNA-3-methyladenine glycosylase, partial [Gammaproteobacteria bacterium]|nr:DNA-3-methyladenine glycosylase [Gammaproteobacteria bacterium]
MSHQDVSFTAQSNCQIFPRDSYARATTEVARNVLGCTLVSTLGPVATAGRIVEVEAYLGSGDPSAHSYNGPTPRTAIQWGSPGHAYVYLIYGMYHCLNFVTEPVGRPGCVLIRA